MLTERQRRVLRAFLHYQLAHGYPPPIRTLMATLGIRSPQGIVLHLAALKAKGFLVASPESGRYGLLNLAGVRWQPCFDLDHPAGRVLAELHDEGQNT